LLNNEENGKFYFFRDTCGRASKVFLTSDLVGQNYLGYLIPNRSQLSLMRLEKTNKQQQIIFGMITNIVAKDAINLSVSIYYLSAYLK